MPGAVQPRLQLVGRLEDAIASTSTALVPRRGGVVASYDVFGYYAALGVTPASTRRELLDAYVARGGQDSDYLTYAFKQIFNRQLRAAYDALKPGQVALDPYRRAELLRAASLQAARMNASGDSFISAKDILSSHGIEFVDKKIGSLDSDVASGFHESGSTFRQEDPHPLVTTWSYAYLLLGSTCDDRSRLAKWQEGLAITLADQQKLPRFAVGFHGLPGKPFLFLEVGDTPVFFLHESAEVTGELVAAAAIAAIS